MSTTKKTSKTSPLTRIPLLRSEAAREWSLIPQLPLKSLLLLLLSRLARLRRVWHPHRVRQVERGLPGLLDRRARVSWVWAAWTCSRGRRSVVEKKSRLFDSAGCFPDWEENAHVMCFWMNLHYLSMLLAFGTTYTAQMVGRRWKSRSSHLSISIFIANLATSSQANISNGGGQKWSFLRFNIPPLDSLFLFHSSCMSFKASLLILSTTNFTDIRCGNERAFFHLELVDLFVRCTYLDWSCDYVCGVLLFRFCVYSMLAFVSNFVQCCCCLACLWLSSFFLFSHCAWLQDWLIRLITTSHIHIVSGQIRSLLRNGVCEGGLLFENLLSEWDAGSNSSYLISLLCLEWMNSMSFSLFNLIWVRDRRMPLVCLSIAQYSTQFSVGFFLSI